MYRCAVVLIATLAVMLVVAPALADDPPIVGQSVGVGATPPEPDSAVVVTPPPAPQGVKGEKGERGEAGLHGPANTEVDPVFTTWLAKRENQHYNRWSRSGSHQEQIKRRKTLYNSWQKQVNARFDKVETLATATSSRTTYALDRVTQALALGGANAVEIYLIKADVESLKTGTRSTSSTTVASVVVPDGPIWPTADGIALLAIIILVLGAVVAAGILLF